MKNSVHLFAGPTVRRSEAPEAPVTWLPPAQLGDVYKSVERGATVIGIIDGFFDHRPAVWHKEILFALSRGVAVAGAASMGALRAAELDGFGMVGVGWVYQQFADGLLEDDDEVAMVHAPADMGYRPLSQAMVDIRRTLEHATASEMLSPTQAKALCAAAKRRHFKERSLALVLNDFKTAGAPFVTPGLITWLAENTVQQKKIDGLELIAKITQGEISAPSKGSVQVPNTVYWEHFLGWVGQHTTGVSEVLDEIRLLGPQAYESLISQARLRFLALERGRRDGVVPDPVRKDIERSFAKAHQLLDAQNRQRWLSRNQLNEEALHKLLDEEAVVRQVLASLEHAVAQSLPATLRLLGGYSRLSERARRKKHLLALRENAPQPPRSAVLTWYFKRLKQKPPKDLSRWAEACGFANEETFLRAVEGEFSFIYNT